MNVNSMDQVRPLWQRWLLAVVGAIAGNLALRMAMFTLLDLPQQFRPMLPLTISIFTLIGVSGAALAYWLLERRTHRPLRTFRLLALPNIAMANADPAMIPFPFFTPALAYLLVAFHVIPAALCAWLLPAAQA